MIIEFIKSTFENIRERVKNPFAERNNTPFAGAYIIALIFYNWKLIFSLFNFDQHELRKSKIEIISNFLNSESWYYRIGNPVLIAFATILAFYILNNISLGITTFFNRWFRATMLYIFDRSKIVTRDELSRTTERMNKLMHTLENLRTVFANSQSEIEILKKSESSLTSKLNEIGLINQGLINDKNELSAENSSLSRSLETLKANHDNFRVLFASYGFKEVTTDVTRTVSGLLSTNLRFLISNEILGSDPAFGKIKKVFIVYEYQRAIKTITSIEGSEIFFENDTLKTADTEVSTNYKLIIQDRMALSSIFEGTWMLKTEKKHIISEEFVHIDSDGEYYANSKHAYTIDSISIDDKLISFTKVSTSFGMTTNEVLTIKNSNQIVGNNSLGSKIEYYRIED